MRLSPDVKARIRRAANILGQDLTEFAADTLNSRALEVIETNERFVLSEKEYEFFLNYLSEGKPAKPTKKSIEALKRYRKEIKRFGDED